MFSHEETERKIQNESKMNNIFFRRSTFVLFIIEEIIWKRYMAGWREVCDECSTTLFNYHYMCKICGYMICIECCSQMNTDKRKSKKRLEFSLKILILYFCRIKTNLYS
jgi:hypothetical protein